MPDVEADFVLTGAGRLVTCTPGLGEGPLGVIEAGAVAARAGRIVWVGRASELAEHVSVLDDAADVDAGGRAVLPGLVDAHTHLVFAGDRSEEFAARTRGEAYDAGGVRTTVAATRRATDDELATLARARLDRFLSYGVTTVEAKSGYGLTPDNERRLLAVAAALEHPVRVVNTFMGAHVVPDEFADDADVYVEMVCEQMIPKLGGLATFVDAWCDRGAFTVEQCRRVLGTARAAGYKTKLHADQLAHTGAAGLAAGVRATSADHLEHVTWDDAEALAEAGTIAVLLPGASLVTGGPYPPARLLIERGVRVALSTDFNPGSSYTENLPLQVALACARLTMTVEEALMGVTRHAAAAIAKEGEVGSIEPGAACDLLVLEATSEVDLAYHYGVNLTRLVIARGRPGGTSEHEGTSKQT